MLPKKRIITIDVSIGSYQDFLIKIIKLAKKRKSNYICVANVHMTIEAYNDKNFQEVVNNAIITTPDGMPLIMALRLIYRIKQERIPGPDLMPVLLKELEKNNLSAFFYGSTINILNEMKKRLQREYPGLTVAGMFSPPFRELTNDEKNNIIEIINNTKANVVFVSLGCPKQEKWMAEMKGKINAVMIGVGAAFPIFTGMQKRAPKWMQKLCLEWLYRLLQDPKRLWRRYFYTNTKFVFLLSKEIEKKREQANNAI